MKGGVFGGLMLYAGERVDCPWAKALIPLAENHLDRLPRVVVLGDSTYGAIAAANAVSSWNTWDRFVESHSSSGWVGGEVNLLDVSTALNEGSLSWEACLGAVFGFDDLTALNEFLRGEDKSLVFVLSGFEDSHPRYSETPELLECFDGLLTLVNRFQDLGWDRLGLLVFAGRDAARLAIRQNFGQFASRFAEYSF